MTGSSCEAVATLSDVWEEDNDASEIHSENPFAGLLKMDLWVFLTAAHYFRRFLRIILPVMKIFVVVSFGIVLGVSILLVHLSFNKMPTTEVAISGNDGNCYAVQQELNRLKSKTLSLESSLKQMRSYIKAVSLKSDSHKEQLPDFASESAGASIIATPDTETFYDETQATLFGIPIWMPKYYTPRKVIQPWSQAGECWAFRGNRGKIEIELAYMAYVNRVTLEHIPVGVSLTGSINSAPKEFRVLGKFRDKYLTLGTFVYDDRGSPTQTFKITRQDIQKTPIKLIMLEILSNWGNPHYTCVYRFKVHGKMFDNFENI